MEDKQILVTSDDGFGAAIKCDFKKFIVARVATLQHPFFTMTGSTVSTNSAKKRSRSSSGRYVLNLGRNKTSFNSSRVSSDTRTAPASKAASKARAGIEAGRMTRLKMTPVSITMR